MPNRQLDILSESLKQSVPCQTGLVELENWRVLAHRGLWANTNQQNTKEAISAAWDEGFSVEIDIRDSNREVVVSHDPIEIGIGLHLKTILDDLREKSRRQANQVIALDVKADGLLSLLPNCQSANWDHFFFDMSVPEFQKYKGVHSQNLAGRLSEFEKERHPNSETPPWLWLDAFSTDWWLDDQVEKEKLELLSREVAVVIVSPELHGRDPGRVWEFFLQGVREGRNLYICTDFPRKILELGKREF